MNAELVRSFFGWCTLLNGGLLIVSSALLMLAGDGVFRIHTRLFPMSREAFNVSIYRFLGLYKIAVISFNLVPWLALTILA